MRGKEIRQVLGGIILKGVSPQVGQEAESAIILY